MATSQKRGNSYLIKVSCGYNSEGKQVVQTKTWTPDEKMTKLQIKKELEKQKFLFEQEVKNGYKSCTIKLSEFVEDKYFVDYAPLMIAKATEMNYRKLYKKIKPYFGHRRLDSITTSDVQNFITYLCKQKTNNRKGRAGEKLSVKTVKNTITAMSSMMKYAVKLQLIQTNPCRNLVLPKEKRKKKTFYTLEEAQQMLDLFENEDKANFKYVVFFTIALFTGLRRGEILGLEWDDFDFKNNIMNVVRDSIYIDNEGMQDNDCKNAGSQRIIKISQQLTALLLKYKAYQDEYKASLGSEWIENGRLFTGLTGKPMNPTMPRDFFECFCKRNNMRYVNNHSFRHFNASMLILNGFDIKTVQSCLGHRQSSTTLDIYAEAFNKQKALAMESVSDSFHLKIG